MNRALAPFFALLLSTGILLVGNGLSSTLVAVRGAIEGFSQLELGLLGSAYFAGFMLGCVRCGRVVQIAGHIRAFAAFAGIVSAAALLQALFPNAIAWAGLRFLVGFCFAGLYLVIESWLNDRSSNETRGGLLAIYLVVNLGAIMIGQLLLNAAPARGFVLFAVISILTSLALVPVSLTRSVQPAPIQQVSLKLKEIFDLSPVGLIGCLVVGLTTSAFWSLGPVFASTVGLDLQGISFFMTATILGGALAQWPVGRISDSVDRRQVIAGVCLLASAGGILLGSAHLALQWKLIPWLAPEPLLLATGFLFGAFALSLYSVCVAHTNDHAGASGDFVSISSTLLLANAAGATLGPIVAVVGAPWIGMASIFFVTAVMHLGFAGFAVFRMSQSPAVLPEEKTNFVPMTISGAAPEPVELDPRSNVTDEQAAEGITPASDWVGPQSVETVS